MPLNLDFNNSLISKRLVIRKLIDCDTLKFAVLLNNNNQDFSKSYTNYPYQENGFDRKSAKDLIVTFDEAWRSIGARIIYIFKDNDLIGALTLSENEDRSASVSYFISQEFRGNGYAAEAQYEVMRGLSKQNLGLNFMAQVLPDNKASISILEKNGFQYKGDALPTKNRPMGNRPVPTFIRGPVI